MRSRRNELQSKCMKYLLRFIILVIFDLLRNLMCYFDHLYIELYTSKNYKNLML